MTNWLKFLQKLADHTDRLALDYFRKVDLAVEYKKDNSPVSEADKVIEEYIRKEAKRTNPCLAVFGEEFGEDAGDLRLIVDPIDGTRNFIRGVPIWATLMAIEDQGKIIAGLVSAPGIGCRWWAEKGQGSFSSGPAGKKQISVSKIKDLSKAQLFHASLSGNEIRKDAQPALYKLIEATERQRGFGDFYQHVLVAQGSGEIAFDPYVKPWDIAALQIILSEAGGKLTSLSGKDSIYEGNALTSNGKLHEQVLKLLSKVPSIKL